jgi:hypothetical protein
MKKQDVNNSALIRPYSFEEIIKLNFEEVGTMKVYALK